jgi:long-chain acyl-CoA synthetase
MDPVPADDLLSPPYDGNVANLLTRTVELFSDTVAVEHAGDEVAYEAFGDRVRRIAGGLHEMGLEPDDRVGVHLPNGIPFCEAIWAAVHAGVVASPLNPEYRRREIEYQLDHSNARAVVTTGAGEEHVVPVAEDLGVEVISTDPDSAHTTLDDLAESGEPTLVDREDDDVILQPYTSGTTGRPKGVLLTHRNFRVQIVPAVSRYTGGQIRGDALVILPMYHITGIIGMTAALSTGRTLHLLRPDQWDPDLVLRKLDEHDVPAFTGVATMFMDLLATYKENPEKYDLSSLRRAGQGGDKLPTPVHEDFEDSIDVPVIEGYGLTETTAATHSVRSSSLGDKVGSVGQPVSHTHSKVVDPQTGEEVPDGEEGEIVVKGPQVMAGYYEDPEATEAAFTEDGYFRTGDLGSRDSDNYYYVSGREKDMILTGGYNVYPSEVERALYDHPEIHEASVFGIPHERKGETVAAAVSLVEGSEMTPEDVKEYVLSELAPYKHPRIVEVRDDLPKTGSGKIRKFKLHEEFVEEYGEVE